MDKYAGSMSVWAYEMQDGHGVPVWIIMNEAGEILDSHDADNFGNILDFWRTLGYDVIINTYQSWEAMDNV